MIILLKGTKMHIDYSLEFFTQYYSAGENRSSQTNFPFQIETLNIKR